MKINTNYNENCQFTMNRMPRDFVDLIMTSPPYADQRTYGGSFDISPDIYHRWFLPIAQSMGFVLKNSGSIILVFDDVHRDGFLHPYVLRTVLHILENTNLRLAQRHYWLKMNSTNCNTKRLKNSVENIFQFVKSNNYYADKNSVRVQSEYAKKDSRAWKYNPLGADPGNVVLFRKSFAQKEVHPALYPEAIPERFIKYLCPPEGIVYDPFAGSGTTGRVARDLGRNFIQSEISKEYFERHLAV